MNNLDQGKNIITSPQVVPCGQLAEVLSQKLLTEVGMGLTEDSKIFLA